MNRRGAACLIGLSVLVAACDTILVPASEPGENLAEFEAAWAWVDSVYPAFEMKGINWDEEYARFRPLAEAARGDEIVQVLNDLLAVLEDSHLYYKTLGGGFVFPHLSSRLLRDRDAFSPHLLRAYFSQPLMVSSDGTFEYQVLDGNLGYVRIATFDRDRMVSLFPEVMEFVRNTDGLILDVRNNNGGDSENVDAVVSRFIDAPLLWMDAFEQDGVPFQPWPIIEPEPVPYRYANPVVVLINGASLSAAEIFPEVMKQLPNVIAVGDTTAGGGCNDRRETDGDRRLPSGRVIHIPTGCLGRYEGGLIEWNGVSPDLRVPMTEGDVERGVDVQLEAAMDYLAGNQGSG